MNLGEWRIRIVTRKGANLTDEELRDFTTSIEWFTDVDLAQMVESKIPAKLIDKVHILVTDD